MAVVLADRLRNRRFLIIDVDFHVCLFDRLALGVEDEGGNRVEIVFRVNKREIAFLAGSEGGR
ncbi:MAG: hypothetical protein Kow00120_16020 [Anaerolineae bacterium]